MSNVEASVPAGWQEIPNPTVGGEMAKAGVPYATVGQHQYYDPTYLTHIANPAQGGQLTNQGYGAVTMGNAQYYNPQQLGQNTAPGAPTNTPPPGDTGIQGPITPTMSSAQTDAWDQLQQTLASYGFSGSDLTSLVAWAKQEIISGNSANQITLDLYKTPQFQQRFPAIGKLSQEGIAITPAQYISMEQSYAQIAQAAGLPPNFASYDQLIANQVSPSEFSARVNQGYLAVAMADPTVINAMKDYYGVTHGQLAGYFLNPNASTPQLLQQAVSAQIGGAAAQSQFNNPNQPSSTAEGISQAQALRMAQMGVTQSQAQSGFKQLSTERQLYTPLPGAGHVGNPLTTDQLLNAQFGSDGQTQLQLQLQAQFNKGMTNQGTNVAQTQQGATGIANVQR